MTDPLKSMVLLERHITKGDFWVVTPKWSTYAVQRREACHECVTTIHACGGRGAHPAQARHKRVTGNASVLLCHNCAYAWREAYEGGSRTWRKTHPA